MVNELLDGNEKIREAVRIFHENECEQTFMDTLYTIRGRMLENGHFLLPVEYAENENGTQIYFKTVDLSDGTAALAVFTDEEELRKGGKSEILSTYIDVCLESILKAQNVEGVVINPFGEFFSLSKDAVEYLLGFRKTAETAELQGDD